MRMRGDRLLPLILLLTVLTAVYVLLPSGHSQPRLDHPKLTNPRTPRPSSYLPPANHRQEEKQPFSPPKQGLSAMSTRGKPQFRHIIVDNMSAVVEIAKSMHRQHGVVLFTMINDAFLDFAVSWSCNVASFPAILQRVLFLTTDLHTARSLQSLLRGAVRVAVINNPQFRGAQEYSRAMYVRLMAERTRVILSLLEAGVRLLLFEVDSVWLKNPLPVLAARAAEGDIIGTRVTGKDVTCGCLLLLNPTKVTVKFWKRLTLMMDQLHHEIETFQDSAKISESKNDQEFFSSLAREKYAGVRIVHLPAEIFPDGKWYGLPEARRFKSRPYIINNNWIVGVEAKRRRAKGFGHWFLDDSQRRCNSSALRLLEQ